MSNPTILRSMRLRAPEELTRQRDALAVGAHRGVGFDRGAHDTLTWLVTGGPGPLTGAMDTVPIGATAMAHELAVAEEILSGPPGAGRRYAAGVLQALLWARMSTSGPWPT
jgi:hypothetical protein